MSRKEKLFFEIFFMGLRFLFMGLIFRQVYLESGAWTFLAVFGCSVALEIVFYIQNTERKIAEKRWKILSGVIDIMADDTKNEITALKKANSAIGRHVN